MSTSYDTDAEETGTYLQQFCRSMKRLHNICKGSAALQPDCTMSAAVLLIMRRLEHSCKGFTAVQRDCNMPAKVLLHDRENATYLQEH